MSILALMGSTRRDGNTDQLAARLLEGLPAKQIFLSQHRIDPIVDKRHDPEGFAPVDDDYDSIIREVLEHDTLLFVTPLYWYGMSAPMKLFVDRWSQSLRDSRFTFRETMRQKVAYAVVVGGPEARVKGLPLIQQFQYIFDFMSMKFGGYIIGEGGRPGEILKDDRALHDIQVLRGRLVPEQKVFI